jgi:hypothetical protein
VNWYGKIFLKDPNFEPLKPFVFDCRLSFKVSTKTGRNFVYFARAALNE